MDERVVAPAAGAPLLVLVLAVPEGELVVLTPLAGLEPWLPEVLEALSLLEPVEPEDPLGAAGTAGAGRPAGVVGRTVGGQGTSSGAVEPPEPRDELPIEDALPEELPVPDWFSGSASRPLELSSVGVSQGPPMRSRHSTPRSARPYVQIRRRGEIHRCRKGGAEIDVRIGSQGAAALRRHLAVPLKPVHEDALPLSRSRYSFSEWLTSCSRRPAAAARAVTSPPGPLRIHAQPSASIAPISGPAR